MTPQILAFKTDWSITENEYQWIVEATKRHGWKTVLEFGPGFSTWAFKEGGACEIVCMESETDWHNTQVRLGILDACYLLCLYPRFSFRVEIPHIKTGFDLAFIDGPAGHELHYARLNTALAGMNAAKHLLLHDTNREKEQRTLEILRNLGCKELERCDPEKGLVLLSTP